MYTLYYAPGACSLSVHITLEWIGQPYKAVRVNPGDADYAKINPAGAVPAMDIGEDEPLTQCAAILRFLGRRFPAANLLDDDTAERAAQLERWSSFLTGDLHPAFFPVFMPNRYTTATDQPALDQVKAAGVTLVAKKLALIDRHLQGREYFAGSKRTVVDAYSVPMVRWASSLFPGGLAEYPDVKRHHETLLRDPGVVKAMIDEGLVKA